MARLARITIGGAPRIIDLAATVTTQFDFYVDSVNGADTADGLTPGTAWKGLAKAATSVTLGPGARIGLACGSLWRETWNWPASTGTAEAPVLCGAYGAGAKPRISGADVVSGWTGYTPPGDAAEALVNGGFETWSNATTPDTWIKFQGGTSTVTQETADTHSGGSAARITVDSANTTVGVQQTVAFTANQPGTYTFWHKLASGAPLLGYQIRIMSGVHVNKYLQANGTWSTTDPGLQSFTAAAAWTQFTRPFTMPDGDGTVRVSIQRSNASAAFLADDASLTLEAVGDAVSDVHQATLATQPYTVAVDGQVWAKAASLASITAGTWWWQSNTLYLQSQVEPDTLLVEAGARENVVYLHESPLRPHIRFQGIRFDLSNDVAVRNNKNDDVTVLGCEFHGSAKVSRNGAYGVSNAAGGAVRRSTFTAISNDGVIGFNWFDPLIEDCTISIDAGATSDCIQFDYTAEPTAGTGWVVRGTTLTFDAPDSTKGCFITFGSDGLFEHNECNGGNFGASMAANSITVRDCVFRDQLALGALRIADNNSSPLSGHLYERVTIIRPQYGIMIESPTGNPNRSNLTYDHLTIADATSRAVYAKNPVSGTIRNSILWAPARTGALIDVASVVSGQTFTLDTCVLGPELPGVALIRWGGVDYNTLAAFQAAHPGVTVGCQVVDPVFTDTAGENYTPAPGSPLLGSATDGTNIGAV